MLKIEAISILEDKVKNYISYWINENARSQKKNIKLKNIKLTIDPGVFDPSPNLTYSSSIVLDNFPNVKNKKILDIGTGSGILLINAIKNGAKIGLGTDIDTEALKCSSMNSVQNGIDDRAVFIWSDLFSTIYDRFDLIFANLPIIEDSSVEKIKELLFFYEWYLKKNGILYLTYASFGSLKDPVSYFKENANVVEVYSEEKFGVDWYLFLIKKT